MLVFFCEINSTKITGNNKMAHTEYVFIRPKNDIQIKFDSVLNCFARTMANLTK